MAAHQTSTTSPRGGGLETSLNTTTLLSTGTEHRYASPLIDSAQRVVGLDLGKGDFAPFRHGETLEKREEGIDIKPSVGPSVSLGGWIARMTHDRTIAAYDALDRRSQVAERAIELCAESALPYVPDLDFKDLDARYASWLRERTPRKSEDAIELYVSNLNALRNEYLERGVVSELSAKLFSEVLICSPLVSQDLYLSVIQRAREPDDGLWGRSVAKLTSRPASKSGHYEGGNSWVHWQPAEPEASVIEARLYLRFDPSFVNEALQALTEGMEAIGIAKKVEYKVARDPRRAESAVLYFTGATVTHAHTLAQFIDEYPDDVLLDTRPAPFGRALISPCPGAELGPSEDLVEWGLGSRGTDGAMSFSTLLCTSYIAARALCEQMGKPDYEAPAIFSELLSLGMLAR